jgi:predicted transport protein
VLIFLLSVMTFPEKHLKYYVAFRRLKNFVRRSPSASGDLLIYAKIDPASVTLEEGFTRDVSEIGHYGTGDLEIRVRDSAALEKAKAVLIDAYRNH